MRRHKEAAVLLSPWWCQHRPRAVLRQPPGVRQRGLVGDPKSEAVTQPHWCWLQFRATITY